MSEDEAQRQRPVEHAAWITRFAERLSVADIVGLLLATAFAIAVIRILQFTFGDARTAVVVYGELNYVLPAVGALLAMVPPLILGIGIGATTYYWDAVTIRRVTGANWKPSESIALTMATFSVPVLLAVAPWTVAVAAALAWTVTIILQKQKYEPRVRKLAARDAAMAADYAWRASVLPFVATTVTLLAVQLAANSAWLPLERISTGEEHFTGYVLDTGNPWTSILLDDSREVQYVQTSEIEKRDLCEDSQIHRVADLIRGTPSVGIDCS